MSDNVEQKIMDICEEYSPKKPGMAKRIREVVDWQTAAMEKQHACDQKILAHAIQQLQADRGRMEKATVMIQGLKQSIDVLKAECREWRKAFRLYEDDKSYGKYMSEPWPEPDNTDKALGGAP